MFKKIKAFATLHVTILAMLAPLALGGAASAAAAPASTATGDVSNCKQAGGDVSRDCVNTGLNCGSNLSIDCTNTTAAPDTQSAGHLTGLLKDVVNIISIIVGVIAVIMIIVAGLQYITSGGSSEKVSGAKNTVIYAIVGLVIVALAQFIVHFVLGTTVNAVNNTTTTAGQ